jgi:catechol 2,3-dioxygenase-like lactoylglutathione lyase family enzyme
MIKGVHTMFYSSDAAGLRTFLRDKLGLKARDIGHGWLIFDLPEADMGCHPADETEGATSGTPNISFYCDDIENTVKELKAKGCKIQRRDRDHGYGLVPFLRRPVIFGYNFISLNTKHRSPAGRHFTYDQLIIVTFCKFY